MPHSASVVAKVVERLHHSRPTVALCRLVEGNPLRDWLHDSSLIVQRGPGLAALKAASPTSADSSPATF